jgi:hypothetical protein
MSGVNGDKARFHRQRKQKIQRRMRNRVMYAQIKNDNEAPTSSPKPSARAGASPRNDVAHE